MPDLIELSAIPLLMQSLCGKGPNSEVWEVLSNGKGKLSLAEAGDLILRKSRIIVEILADYEIGIFVQIHLVKHILLEIENQFNVNAQETLALEIIELAKNKLAKGASIQLIKDEMTKGELDDYFPQVSQLSARKSISIKKNFRRLVKLLNELRCSVPELCSFKILWMIELYLQELKSKSVEVVKELDAPSGYHLLLKLARRNESQMLEKSDQEEAYQELNRWKRASRDKQRSKHKTYFEEALHDMACDRAFDHMSYLLIAMEALKNILCSLEEKKTIEKPSAYFNKIVDITYMNIQSKNNQEAKAAQQMADHASAYTVAQEPVVLNLALDVSKNIYVSKQIPLWNECIEKCVVRKSVKGNIMHLDVFLEYVKVILKQNSQIHERKKEYKGWADSLFNLIATPKIVKSENDDTRAYKQIAAKFNLEYSNCRQIVSRYKRSLYKECVTYCYSGLQ